MQLLKSLILFSLFLTSLSVFAVEKAAEENKDPKAALANKDFSGRQSFEWEKAQANVIASKGRLEAQQALIQTLMAEKSKLSGQALSDKIEQLKKEHTKLKSMKTEYEDLNSEFLTKYPDRGIKEVRVYKRSNKKNSKLSDESMGIDGRINKVHSKILKQYSKQKAVANQPANKDSSHGETNKSGSDSDEKDITDQIELKK